MLRRIALMVGLLTVAQCGQAVPDESAADESSSAGEELGGSLPKGTKLRTTSNVNLRSGPSTNANILTTIPKGATVEVVRSTPQDGFYQLKFEGQQGWCSGQFLALVPNQSDDDGISMAEATTACQRDLVARGIKFKPTKARGVQDAVMVLGPVGGVLFVSGKTTKLPADPVACEFVKTMDAMGQVLKKHGFVKVGTLGSYCYRCCCSWSETNDCRDLNDPEPNCGDNGYSNHSWGRAIDIRYVMKANGTTYDVNNPAHFVISTSGDTCGAGAAEQTAGPSIALYNAFCDLADQGIVANLLTPNRNPAHRNHFHIDIGDSGPAAKSFSTFVD